MTLNFHFNNKLNLIDASIIGLTTKQNIIEAQESVYGSPDYNSSMDELWDFTNCQIQPVESIDLLEIAQHEQSTRFVDNDVRCALVGTDPKLIQMFEEYILLAKELPYEMAIFSSRNDALEWLMS